VSKCRVEQTICIAWPKCRDRSIYWQGTAGHTFPCAGAMKKINQQRLRGRALRYVQIDTTAGEPCGSYPSSPGQLVLGKLLADELREMGLADAKHDQHGLARARLPATT